MRVGIATHNRDLGDAYSFPCRFFLAPQELWKACVFYESLHKDHDRHTFASEYVLAMGLFQASNVAQRAAHAIVHLFHTKAREIEHEEGFTAAEQQWLTPRESIAHSVESHSRLWSMSMYTDDTFTLTIGIPRTVRLIKAWHWVTRSMNLLMAIPEKRHLGTHIYSLGAHLFVAEMVMVIPTQKILRALAMIKQLVVNALTFSEYRTLLGLLEHFLALNNARRNVMYYMYEPFMTGGDPPPQEVYQPSPIVIKQAENWYQTLAQCSGCHFYHALPGAAPVSLVSIQYHLYSDAALEGAPIPSLGGYFHGFWWCLPLSEATKQLDIPHLEFAAAVINFVLFARLVSSETLPLPASSQIFMHVDGQATPDVLAADAARAPVMQFIHDEFTSMPEFQQLATSIHAGHAYGDTNTMADAASRGYYDLLHRMAAQMGVVPVRLTVPQDMEMFVMRIYAMHRTFGARRRDSRLARHNSARLRRR